MIHKKIALIFTITFPTILTWAYFIALANSPTILQQSVYSLGKLIQFGFPIIFALVIEKWRPTNLNFSNFVTTYSKNCSSGMMAGLFSGLAIMFTGMGAYYFYLLPSGFLDNTALLAQQKVTGMGIVTVGQYFLLSAFYSIFHSLLEEYYWRWFVYGRLKEFLNVSNSIITSSLGFMSHHILVLGTFFGYSNPLTYILSIGVAIGGAIWATLFERSRSLLGPWLSHCLVDAGIFLIGYKLIWP